MRSFPGWQCAVQYTFSACSGLQFSEISRLHREARRAGGGVNGIKVGEQHAWRWGEGTVVRRFRDDARDRVRPRDWRVPQILAGHKAGALCAALRVLHKTNVMTITPLALKTPQVRHLRRVPVYFRAHDGDWCRR